MRILLMCAGGWSTGLLVEDMKKYASEEDEINAIGYDAFEKNIDNYDIFLVGPQMSYKFKEIEKKAKEYGKVAGKIDSVAYGRIQGEKVYNQAKDLLSE